MKKLQHIILIAIIALFYACSDDYIEVDPQGSLDEQTLAQSEETINQAVTAAYSGLPLRFADYSTVFLHPPNNWSYGDVRSDDCYKGGNGLTDLFEYHNFEVANITPVLPVMNSKWGALYVAVNRCNSAISLINNSEPDVVSEEFKTEKIAELRFLRGHFYFDLVKNFKIVPWIDETIPSGERDQVSNTLSHQELLDLIAADFQAGIDALPDEQSEPGRATRIAALAYKARVHLFAGQYDQALPLLEQVIGTRELLTDFDYLDNIDYENESEFIFSIQYSIDDGSEDGLARINWGNLICSPFLPYYGFGDDFYRPSQNLANAYKTGSDGLPLLDTFNDSNLSPDDFKDPRLDHTLARPGIPWKNDWLVEFKADYPRDAANYGFQSHKKWVASPTQAQAGFPWGASALNSPIIRYADVLLMAAECHVENGSTEQARELVNQVRQRAKNSSYQQNLAGNGPADNYLIELYPAGSFSDVNYARKAVRMERRLELAMEGLRFYDLVRYGTAANVMNTYFAEEAEERSYYAGASFEGNKEEFLPIPQNQIDLSNGVLTQNAPY